MFFGGFGTVKNSIVKGDLTDDVVVDFLDPMIWGVCPMCVTRKKNKWKQI